MYDKPLKEPTTKLSLVTFITNMQLLMLLSNYCVGSCVMAKRVSCCCAHGSRPLSNLYSYIYVVPKFTRHTWLLLLAILMGTQTEDSFYRFSHIHTLLLLTIYNYSGWQVSTCRMYYIVMQIRKFIPLG